MRVLITGAGGQVATSLLECAPEAVDVVGLSRSECDITDMRGVAAVMRSVRPNVVVNAAAFTSVDRAELEREVAFAVNAEGTGILARAAAEHGARYLHISTDYVFGGDVKKPYAVDDAPNPRNAYGASKLQGEQEALATSGQVCIVRTAWLYSQHGSNFMLAILRALRKSSELSVVCDQIGTPTSAPSLAGFLWQVAQKESASGVYHWTDDGTASWHEFAVAIAEEARSLGILEQTAKIRPVTSAEYVRAASRPHYSVLDTTRAQIEFSCRPRYWRDELVSVLSAIAT